MPIVEDNIKVKTSRIEQGDVVSHHVVVECDLVDTSANNDAIKLRMTATGATQAQAIKKLQLGFAATVKGIDYKLARLAKEGA